MKMLSKRYDQYPKSMDVRGFIVYKILFNKTIDNIAP